MAPKKEFAITKKNIPLIIKAVDAYGDLPYARSEKTILILEILLRLSLANQNNIAITKISTLAKMANCSASLTGQKLQILIKYNFIKSVPTERPTTLKQWEINILKLQSVMITYQTAQDLTKRISKHQKPD